MDRDQCEKRRGPREDLDPQVPHKKAIQFTMQKPPCSLSQTITKADIGKWLGGAIEWTSGA